MMEDLSVPVEFRMAENDRLRAELKQATGECYRLGHLNISHKAELDRLRAENAELQAEIERWDETDPLVNKRLKEDLHEILTLRAEKALLVEECLSHAEIAESECNFGFAQTLREIAALAKTRSNDPETEPYEPPPYDWGKDKIP